VTIIGQNVETLMEVKKLGERILDGWKCETLHNSQNLTDLVIDFEHTRVLKSMKIIFKQKDWNKYKDEGKVTIKKLVDWHREQTICLL